MHSLWDEGAEKSDVPKSWDEGRERRQEREQLPVRPAQVAMNLFAVV